ncbi:4'-phosphopantetheinyl transferase family protein [Pseudidiomarina sp. E22-M8]|uniref:4'-phosphopantetheinyl transferase family protein n=1 Tax=Pseudidiomarina sp. E22-M8 TaxID=3424768 RepID=UPI00403C6C66
MSVFATDLAALVSHLSPWLSDDEQRQAEQYRRPLRQLQFLAARGVVRWLLQSCWNYPAAASVIKRQPNGAPQLQVNGEPWCCSISHSHDIVMVALSPDQMVGVDVERVKPRKQLARLLQSGFMAGVETAELVQFYQRWTLAEAVTKAEQGLLLDVLKRSPCAYEAHACFRQTADYMLCCYTPDARSNIHQLLLTGAELVVKTD